jgi:hypothetical protein
MSLSNLSLEALKSVISTANEDDCNLLLKLIKKQRLEIDTKIRYVLIEIDSDYTWKKPYVPRIWLDVECAPSKLAETLHTKLNIYIESYDDDYLALCWQIVECKQFFNVQGEQAEKMRESKAWGGLDPTDEFANIVALDYWKLFFKKLGLKLFEEIDRSVGLLNFFDNFGWSCGVLCLLKYSKSLDKLIRNGLPWEN